MRAQRGRVQVAIVVAAVAIAVTGTAMYVTFSRRFAVQPSLSEQASIGAATTPAATPGAAPRATAPSIEVSAEKLAQRLRENGGSADDWALLARSYVQIQRYPEAVDAFGKALEKLPGNPAFVAEQSAARKAAAEAGAPR